MDHVDPSLNNLFSKCQNFNVQKLNVNFAEQNTNSSAQKDRDKRRTDPTQKEASDQIEIWYDMIGWVALLISIVC